jgi:hypothetical protein
MRRKQKHSIHDKMVFFDGEGASGGEGNTGGGGAPAVAAPSLSKDDVNAMINGAVKGLESKLTKTFGDTVSHSMTPVLEQLQGFGEVIKALGGNRNGAGAEGGNAGAPGSNVAVDPVITARLLETERKAKTLESTVTQLQEENKQAKLEAERAERHSRIRSALGGMQFVSDDAAETAFELMERAIRRDPETGNLVGGPEGAVLPYDVYVKEALNSKHGYLLGMKQNGGAGAVRGDNRFATSGMTVGTTEMIKPGMRPEERAAVVAQIQAVGHQLGRGNN